MSSTSATRRHAQVGRQAVARLRDVVRSGLLGRWAAVDLHSGEIQNPEARALFASLPSVSPATAPHELIDHGLITSIPRNLRSALATPKYRLGREVFVQAPVKPHAVSHYQPVGEYSAQGPIRFTHRAVLRAARGDDFIVELPGAQAPMPFRRAEVFGWNEPVGVPAAGGQISGVQIDYNDPLLKAHICAGFIDIDEELGRLDFEAPDAAEIQARLVHRLASRLRMTYPGRAEGYSGSRAGALLCGGQGVCFTQRALAGAYLQAFASTLAFEVQIAVGRTLRLSVPHGFVVVLLRPSLDRFVCDPAWAEPLTDLRVAFFGPGWGHDRMLLGFEGEQDLRVSPDEVDLPPWGGSTV